jgi:arylsulfatase A-like enzyme
MIVAGPGVARPGSTHDALIHTADIFATVAELTGASDYLPAKFPKQPKRQKPFGSHKTLSFGLPAGPLDSVSFAPYLGDPALPSIRTHVYSERFFPNGTGAPTSFARAIRNHEFKLIVHHGSPGPPDMYLYNLKDDFFEQQNLLELPLGVDEMLALAELQQELLELLLD